MTVSWDNTRKRWLRYTVQCYGPFSPSIPPWERKTVEGYAVKLERFFTNFDGGKTGFQNRRGSSICKHLFISGDSVNSVGLIFLWRLVTMSPPLSLLCSLAQALLWNFTVHSSSFPSIPHSQTYRHMYSVYTHKAVQPRYMIRVQCLFIISSQIVLQY